jgi:cytochrome c peroxidase
MVVSNSEFDKNFYNNMKQLLAIILLVTVVFSCISFSTAPRGNSLRKKYSKPPSKWPAPHVFISDWKELGSLPPSPLNVDDDSTRQIVELGKLLFFDPRLSGSGKISCASCHQPELSWTDGKARSLGHEGLMNKRNAPTIQNSWYYSRLFWDGRSSGLEDQAFAPINSESEMHHDMRELPGELKKIGGYRQMFEKAFGDPSITPDRIAGAIAQFERTITSAENRFDRFVNGDGQALNDEEIFGLHIFRTKAGCMNCHHGPLLTDDHFHNNGFAGADQGYYKVTHNDADLGKFKTPSLRDIMFTSPYMHDGSQLSLAHIIDRYDEAMPIINRDQLIQPLHLTSSEKQALLAFLKALSAPPRPFQKPVLPE